MPVFFDHQPHDAHIHHIYTFIDLIKYSDSIDDSVPSSDGKADTSGNLLFKYFKNRTHVLFTK